LVRERKLRVGLQGRRSGEYERIGATRGNGRYGRVNVVLRINHQQMERQMARKSKPVKTTREAGEIYTSDPLTLNQWCIEMAMRWPIDSGSAGMMSTYTPASEADVIDRADRIMTWVKKRH
jgi:hypothetical protein